MFSHLENVNNYICFLHQENEITMNIINLTETHFILFKILDQPKISHEKWKVPKETEIKDLVLIFYAEIGSL